MLCSLMQMVSLRHAYSRLQSCRRCYTQSAVECQRIEQDGVAQFSHVNARSSVTVTNVNGDVVLHAPNIEEEDLNITELNAQSVCIQLREATVKALLTPIFIRTFDISSVVRQILRLAPSTISSSVTSCISSLRLRQTFIRSSSPKHVLNLWQLRVKDTRSPKYKFDDIYIFIAS